MATISVIVPVYKVEPYLRRCIDSILKQSLDDFEIVLIDDGSPDNCGKICDEYAALDSRIHVIHQNNGGLSAARNAGLDWAFKNSSSRWIIFVDSDDWVSETCLEDLLIAAEQHKTLISSGKYCQVFSDGHIEETDFYLKQGIISGEELITHNGHGVYAYSWSRLYAKKLWTDVRFPAGKKWEDIAVMSQIFLPQDEIAFVDKLMYFYFVNENGIVYSPWNLSKLDYYWAVQKALSEPEMSKHATVRSFLQNSFKFGIVNDYRKVREELNLAAEEKIEAVKLLKRYMKWLIKNSTPRLTIKNAPYCFNIAYPLSSKMYWVIYGLTNKFHRRNND